MIICIAGKNEIACKALMFLLKKKQDFNIECIYGINNSNDSGVDGWQKSFKKCCTDNNIKIININDAQKIKDLILISLEYNKIIPVLSFDSQKLYNIHFSLLPRYRGCFTSIWPIRNGDDYTGVTLHKMNSGIDTGDVIDFIKFKINTNDTSRDLYIKYMKYAFILFKKNIIDILNSDYSCKEQDVMNASYYARKSIDFSSVNIDFNKKSNVIHNYIRSFIFKEYQLPTFMKYKIAKSILTNQIVSNKQIVEKKDVFEISGIDSYKIILEKDQ